MTQQYAGAPSPPDISNATQGRLVGTSHIKAFVKAPILPTFPLGQVRRLLRTLHQNITSDQQCQPTVHFYQLYKR